MRRTCLILSVLALGFPARAHAEQNPFRRPVRALLTQLEETPRLTLQSPTAPADAAAAPAGPQDDEGLGNGSGATRDGDIDAPPDRSPDDFAPADDFVLPPLPPVRGSLSAQSIYGSNRSAAIVDNSLVLPELMAPTTSLEGIGERLPEDAGGQALARQMPLPEGIGDRQGAWDLSAYFWQAPNTFSNPIYWEDAMLERHGHERFPAVQPLAAGVRFFATFPMLPYLMTVRNPHDLDYHMGYYRVGSGAPLLLQRPPYVRRAALVEAAAVADAIIIFP